jgi:hypothetical protein
MGTALALDGEQAGLAQPGEVLANGAFMRMRTGSCVATDPGGVDSGRDGRVGSGNLSHRMDNSVRHTAAELGKHHLRRLRQ